ncbi:DUF3168 domain-containing protein [Oryzibacter oryziterrae]|uniref:DUF3168 domain-containing protein n=1 Tax=Oryzibacter oryziterrae TaxID=2766474 RepID=UPI001F316972|nr:DUF3168 domain-containing protein [Oryzibacter oryziterrae]
MTARQTAAIAALQTALTTAFKADATLTGLVKGRIHDGLPRGPVMPCLVFADARGRDFSSGDGTGARVLLALEAYAGDTERSRALAVLDAALAVATTAPLSLTTGSLTLIRVSDTQVDRTRDGAWRARAVIDALIDQ